MTFRLARCSAVQSPSVSTSPVYSGRGLDPTSVGEAAGRRGATRVLLSQGEPERVLPQPRAYIVRSLRVMMGARVADRVVSTCVFMKVWNPHRRAITSGCASCRSVVARACTTRWRRRRRPVDRRHKRKPRHRRSPMEKGRRRNCRPAEPLLWAPQGRLDVRDCPRYRQTCAPCAYR